MGMFKKNKFNSQKEKLSLIDKIGFIQTQLKEKGLYKIYIQLDEIVKQLDDIHLVLTGDQNTAIKQCLNTIERHVDQMYYDLLYSKCQHIKSCLSDTQSAKDVLNMSIANEDKLFEILGQLNELEKEITAIQKRMDMVIGNNKNLWEMLNAKKKMLLNRKAVFSKNYNLLLQNQNNVALAVDVERARAEAEEIANRSSAIDIGEFNANIEFANSIESDTIEMANKMGELFNDGFGCNLSNFEYEKALEEKRLYEAGIEEQGESAKVKKA